MLRGRKSKSLKKCLSVLLAVAIILSSAYVGINELDFSGVFAVKAKAADEGYLVFDWNEDSESYSVRSCEEGVSGVLIIPDTYFGFPVTTIEDSAFYECDNLTSITIPDSVISIGEFAFGSCDSLISVTISNNVVQIGYGAFAGCTNLTEIIVPDNVVQIGYCAFENTGYYNDDNNWENNVLYINKHLICAKDTLSGSYTVKDGTKTIADYAFSDCESLTAITISDSVVSIGEEAFRYCVSLTSITIPDGVTSIGGGAFGNCYSLNSIIIGDSVANIGIQTFYNCKSLTSINVGENNNNYSSVDGVIFNKDKSTLICFPKGDITEKYTIPDSVTSIGDYAFEMCTTLTTVTISDSVTSIGYNAFGYCEGLISITIPDSIINIDEYAFWDCCNLKYVFYSSSESDWNNIVTGRGNERLTTKAIIHYNSTGHTASGWIIGVESTCSEEGSQYTECTVCGEIISTEAIPTTSHSYSTEWTIDKESTYSAEGSKSRHCLNCSAQTDVTAIPVEDFREVMYVTQEGGTCNGRITYVVYLKEGISVNGAIINVEFDENAIDVYDGGAYTVLDSYGDPIQKVSGIYESGLRYDATNVYSIAYINMTSKTLSNDTPFMKITFNINDGYTEAPVKFTCKEFNSNNPEHNVPNTETPVMIFEEIADITISGHCSSDWIVDEAATVFDVGYEHRECITCGEFLETKVIPQLVCQEPELDSVVQNESGLLFTWNAVEGADEYEIYRKTDSTEWMLLSAVDGNSTSYVDVNVERDKVYYYTIQAINEAGASSYNSDGLGCEFHIHSFGDWTITTSATCTTTGERYRVCIPCGDEEFETIDSLGHDYLTEWTIDVKPTCTEEGSKSHHCSRCESVADVTIIEPIGHSYGYWIITKAPTCTEQGSLSKTCSECGDVKNEAIAINAHSYSTEWTIDIEPTCTEKGSKSHHCTVCGDKADVTVIEANGHSYSDWITSTAPTCTENGLKYKVCSVCDDVITETITATGHDYLTEWTIDVEATCTEDGSKSHHCVACGDKADITVIKSTGHNYEVKDVALAHPHTVLYQCSYCDETKTENTVVSDCIECNFTITYVKETDSYKLVSYIGTQADVAIPATYNECAVTTIANGCFKGNASIRSVEIADGVNSIGSLAFMNCTSLEKVVIPASVTSIGSQAFYNFKGTIYCTRDSFAHEYAIANSIDYVLLSILETENTRIDYDNFLVFTNVQHSYELSEIFGISETAIAIPVASHIFGNYELYGTGTIITVFDGDDYIGDFTLIVEGDLNGDSVCDVLDAAVAHLYSVGLDEPSKNEILAANGCVSDEIDVNSYQNVVNMVLAG